MGTKAKNTEKEVGDFAENMRKLGVDITQYDPNDKLYLYKVAKLCAKQAGLPMGIAVGAATAGAGSVTLPFIGAVPGYIAGFLAGAAGGTVACTLGRISMKRDLDHLLRDSSESAKYNVISTP